MMENLAAVTAADESAALKALNEMEAGVSPAEAEQPAPPQPPAQLEAPAIEPVEEEEIRVVETPVPLEPEPRENRPAKVHGDPESRIRQLTWEREQEKRRAEQALYQAQIAAQEKQALLVVANALRGKLESTATDNHAITVGAKQIMEERAKSEIAFARQLLAEALANGDNAKVTEAMERLTTAKVQEEKVGAIQMADSPARPQEIVQFDQIAQQLAQPAPPRQELPQPYQEWRTRNVWYTQEPGHPLRQLSLHAEQISAMIEAEGKAPHTAEHFAELETRLRPVLSQVFGGVAQSTAPQQAQVVPPAAASSPQPQQPRSIPVAPVGAPRVPAQAPRKTTEVTAAEAALAKQFGLSLADYVKGSKGIPLK